MDTAALFAAAADILAGKQPPAGTPLDLLTQLGYGEPNTNRIALLRAASSFRRMFTLTADDAPGLVAFGAEIGIDGHSSAGVSGTGLTLHEAFESCVGEGIEFLSQFPSANDPLMPLPEHKALDRVTPAMRDLWHRLRPYRRHPSEPATWTLAADLATGQPTLIPADLCFRRQTAERDLDPPIALSIGCGAGADPLRALLHALLELIERDAVSLRQQGGRRGRVIAPGIGAGTLAALRGNVLRRRTWLLDITSDIAVPVVAAVSCNDDGLGICIGHAARPKLAMAAHAALLEVTQMELAHQIARQKQANSGEAILSAIDRQHIARYSGLAVSHVTALHPIGPPRGSIDLSSTDPDELVASVVERLAAVGLTTCVINLSRPALGVSVMRAFSPAMEVVVTAPCGPRLLAEKTLNGVDPAGCPPF